MAAARKTTQPKTTKPKTTKRKTVKRKVAAKSAPRKKKTSPSKSAARKRTAAPSSSGKRWSQDVTEHSEALDLKHGVFKQTDPKKIAASLKRSAEKSSRRKTGAYRSALSMLTFYVNRAGKTLPKAQHARLERAKDELKKAFGRA